MTRTIITRICFFICACFLHISSYAQQYSFVYIQGDKTLPFYVKLGDEMLPRYGKNYFILPMLEAGDINIEVLFQQNKYPSERFTIKVPENSSRSFLLTKKDAAYALYDLQQGFYLYNGNSVDDDHLPTAIANIPTQALDSAEPIVAIPAPTKKEAPPKPVVAKKTKGSLLKKEKKPLPQQGNTPTFIGDIELNNQHEKTNQEQEPAKAQEPAKENVPEPVATVPAPVTTSNEPPATVPNSDCPNPAAEETLEKIYKKTMAEDSEESRLGYLLQQADHCFSTTQLRWLAKSLDTDTARYSLLKKFYPRVTDQDAFPALEDLFASEDWKNYFKQLVNK